MKRKSVLRPKSCENALVLSIKRLTDTRLPICCAESKSCSSQASLETLCAEIQPRDVLEKIDIQYIPVLKPAVIDIFIISIYQMAMKGELSSESAALLGFMELYRKLQLIA